MEIEKISFFNRLEYEMESNETELETISLENSNLEYFNNCYLKFFTEKNILKKGKNELPDVTDIFKIKKESIIIGKKTLCSCYTTKIFLTCCIPNLNYVIYVVIY